MDELQAMATELGIQPNGEVDTTKDSLINLIVQARNEREGSLFLEGVLEIVDEGYGFIRRDPHWMASAEDVYVSQSQIRRFSLRTGDLVSGQVRPARPSDRYHGLVRVVAVNGLDPERVRNRPLFEKLVAVFPNEQLRLEFDKSELTSRVIDIVSPIGRGQRGLVFHRPRLARQSS